MKKEIVFRGDGKSVHQFDKTILQGVGARSTNFRICNNPCRRRRLEASNKLPGSMLRQRFFSLRRRWQNPRGLGTGLAKQPLIKWGRCEIIWWGLEWGRASAALWSECQWLGLPQPRCLSPSTANPPPGELAATLHPLPFRCIGSHGFAIAREPCLMRAPEMLPHNPCQWRTGWRGSALRAQEQAKAQAAHHPRTFPELPQHHPPPAHARRRSIVSPFLLLLL